MNNLIVLVHCVEPLHKIKRTVLPKLHISLSSILRQQASYTYNLL